MREKVEQCFADCKAELETERGEDEASEFSVKKVLQSKKTVPWEIDVMNKETNNTVGHPANDLMDEMNEIVLAQPQGQWDDLPF